MTKPASVNLRVDAEDRFDRLRRIEWWDQDKVRSARVLVIGAGALGNEILKNLALLGVGRILVADFDEIEVSNLSRSVLYRDADVGRPKAEVAASRVREIYSDAKVQSFHGDVIYELGVGAYRWADVIIAGLDNREARLHVNRCCYRANRPWVDAATELFQGIVRVFQPPDGPCYECTMSAADWQALEERRGCTGFRASAIPPGRVPTTPVTASIVAAIQCQEAMKILHGLDCLRGRGFVFDGLRNDSYVFPYQRNEDCNSHDTLQDVVELEGSASTLTLQVLLNEAERRLGSGTVIEFPHELLVSLHCSNCGGERRILKPLGTVTDREAVCERCGQGCTPHTVSFVKGIEDFLHLSCASLGIAPFDVLSARNGFSSVGFELSGDAGDVLGPVFEPRVE